MSFWKVKVFYFIDLVNSIRLLGINKYFYYLIDLEKIVLHVT